MHVTCSPFLHDLAIFTILPQLIPRLWQFAPHTCIQLHARAAQSQSYLLLHLSFDNIHSTLVHVAFGLHHHWLDNPGHRICIIAVTSSHCGKLLSDCAAFLPGNVHIKIIINNEFTFMHIKILYPLTRSGRMLESNLVFMQLYMHVQCIIRHKVYYKRKTVHGFMNKKAKINEIYKLSTCNSL